MTLAERRSSTSSNHNTSPLFVYSDSCTIWPGFHHKDSHPHPTAPHPLHRFALHPRRSRISVDVFIAYNTLTASLAYLRAFLLLHSSAPHHPFARPPKRPSRYPKRFAHPCLLFGVSHFLSTASHPIHVCVNPHNLTLRAI